MTLAKFQFHKGTIRTDIDSHTLRKEERFQFHKGTIRTSLSWHPLHSRYAFQFHKGTIRTTLQTLQNIGLGNFNSIKVRLEPYDLLPFLLLASNFNSIKVRLEHSYRKILPFVVHSVLYFTSCRPSLLIISTALL